MSGHEAAADGELILAIDAGTQSMRAGLVDFAGNVTGVVKLPIEPYVSPRPGWAEQSPDYYWQMLCRATKRLLAENPGAGRRLRAVAMATQRHTFVNVDRDGNALRPAIVWLDTRKADMRKVLPGWGIGLARALRQYQLFEYATESCRSNWIRQHEPEIWDRTYKYLFLSGFLALRLTGEFRDSTANMLGTVPFDVKKGAWASGRDLKRALFPIEPDKLPEVVPPAATLGAVTAKAAEETGIPVGLPMIAAANDKACDVIGTGCLTPDHACISFGTTATLNTEISRYVELRPFIAPYPAAVPGQFYTEVSVFRGLWLVSWFRDEFGQPERQQAEGRGVAPEELLEKLIREVPPGSMGLVCQPYWTPGPELDPTTKGAIFGFGDVHTRAHLYRAILEGLVFALKEGGALTQKRNKVEFAEIRATGGGSKSDAIVQMTADIFGLPVRRPHTPETSVLGAAMNAAVGLGAYPDVPSAVAAMSRSGGVFDPKTETRAIYQGLYERVYLRAYDRLLPLYREIAEVTGYPAAGEH
jgi:sugar (pentulose or hexulose) kinase